MGQLNKKKSRWRQTEFFSIKMATLEVKWVNDYDVAGSAKLASKP